MLPPWLFWAVLAFFCYGTWAVLSKWFGEEVAPAHLQVMSTLGMLPVIGALAILKGPPDPGNRRRGILVALIGGTVSCLGNIPFFDALAGAKAAAVVPITALYPVVTVILAVVVLRERLDWLHVGGIALPVAAIYLLNVSNESGLLSPLLLVALVPVLLWGIAGFLQKLSTYDITGNTSAAWFLAAFVPVGIIVFVWQPLSSALPWQTWVKAGALGFMLAFGNYAVTVAYAANGKASVITPLVGLYPLASIPAAVWLFDEQIGWREALGAVLALVSIAALSHETALKPVPAAARKV
jgi:drug/metabolite transporter (DMT)-like permease